VGSSDPQRFGDDFVLTLFTNQPDLAAAADAAGVDRVGIDVEELGKEARQRSLAGHRISRHQLADLGPIRKVLRRARLFCRLDPLHPGTREQVERALGEGAQSLMLPYFREVDEARAFAAIVDGRAELVLLVETAAAAWRIDVCANLAGVDEIMIGLTDLSLDCRVRQRLELLTSPFMAAASAAVRSAGKRFTTGGLGRWNDTGLPISPDLIYAQYPRLDARGALLGQSFMRGVPLRDLAEAVSVARDRLRHWAASGPVALEQARCDLVRACAAD
jgi:hypothetical protein